MTIEQSAGQRTRNSRGSFISQAIATASLLLCMTSLFCQAASAQTGAHVAGKETRQTYGHSLAVDPWGHVIAKASDGVGIVSTRIDRDLVKKVRAQIPVAQHKVRFD